MPECCAFPSCCSVRKSSYMLVAALLLDKIDKQAWKREIIQNTLVVGEPIKTHVLH